MTEFTKEQLIAHIGKMTLVANEVIEKLPEEYALRARRDIAVYEIALAVLTAKPFMYGIADPAGGPHFAEFCVSGNLQHIEKEVETQNAIEEIDVNNEPHYRVAPLYRLPEVK